MTDPLSITCPHCTASFKVKSTSAFGKKIKCPKCDEPFVIQKPTKAKSAPPKKKTKKAKPKIDFFDDDEADSSTDMFEDEFDDWDADLSESTSTRGRQKQTHSPTHNKQTQILNLLKEYGFSPVVVGICLFLFVLLFLTLIFQNSTAIFFSFILSDFIGLCLTAIGFIWLLVIVKEESFEEICICLTVPFYIHYYAISRFKKAKRPFATMICGLILFMSSFGFLLTSMSFSGKNVWGKGLNNHQIARMQQDAIKNQKNHEEMIAEFDKIHQNIKQRQPNSPHRSLPNSGINSSRPSIKPDFSQLKKFDLTDTKPMLMSWPSGGSSNDRTYREINTGSIGKVFEVTNSRTFSGEEPAGSAMKFRVYLPPDIAPSSPVPCILVPPAGSNLLTGMKIDSTDTIPNPEHEPYVKAGFAVITFSLDGDLRRREQSTNMEVKMAHQDFKKSKAGLVNCVHAFLETQAVIPGIDKNNIFIAGHSSAGTLSLLFAEHYPQIKGCMAYAPSVDLKKSMAEFVPELKPLIPEIEDFLRLSSPQTHIKDLKCPVFLFHSRGDQVTSFQNSYQFASQLTAQGTDVEFVAGAGSDHYQTMIDEGLPKGIEWLKKQITNPNSSQPAPQMTSAKDSETKKTNKPSSPPAISPIDITRKRATFQVKGFDQFFQNALNGNREFWKKSLIEKAQRGLKEFAPSYIEGSEILDLNKMTFSFEFAGTLPTGIPQKFEDHFFAKSMKLADEAPVIKILNTDANSRLMDSNFLTFSIRFINRLQFNKNASPNIIEVNLKQIDRYVPGSLIINYENKWAYIKLKGIGEKREIERKARSAFQAGGIIVNAKKIELTPDDLAMSGSASNTTTNIDPSNTTSASTAKKKYVIRYGVYGGKSAKESVKRSLKGFVWVDQKSIQFDPNSKEISFINQSPVDHGALNRALTRNKFYQLNISQETVPETENEPKTEGTKAGT